MSIELRLAILRELEEIIIADLAKLEESTKINSSWTISITSRRSNSDFVPRMFVYYNRRPTLVVEAYPEEMVVRYHNLLRAIDPTPELTYEWSDPGLIKNVLKDLRSAITER